MCSCAVGGATSAKKANTSTMRLLALTALNCTGLTQIKQVRALHGGMAYLTLIKRVRNTAL